MKFFPLKTAIFCLVVTPVLYTLTLTAVQSRLNRVYLDKIRNVMIRDTGPLLEGAVTLEAWIGRNIKAFLKTDRLVGVADLDIAIFVTTQDGRLVYPEYANSQEPELRPGIGTKELAGENYAILSAGLNTIVEIRLTHGSRIANLILALYVLVSLGMFSFLYRSGSRKARKDLKNKTAMIEALKSDEARHKKHMADLKQEKQALFDRMRKLDDQYRTDQKKAKINEEEMFDEIVHLEDELARWREVEQAKASEIDDLKSQLQKYERRKTTKTRRNEYDFLGKRFAALYKNTLMNRKAISGFLNLSEDQQIKAEEIILQLDQSPDQVIIKRKVFAGKKHKAASFEVLFAYNGRLYFRTLEGGQIEVLVIGTKNSQARDMEFLHNL